MEMQQDGMTVLHIAMRDGSELYSEDNKIRRMVEAFDLHIRHEWKE